MVIPPARLYQGVFPLMPANALPLFAALLVNRVQDFAESVRAAIVEIGRRRAELAVPISALREVRHRADAG